MKRYNRYFWFVGVAAGMIFLPSFLCLFVAETVFFSRPRTPTVDSGWTAPYVVKGAIHFIAQWERDAIGWVKIVVWTSFAILLICAALRRSLSFKWPPPNH